MGYRVAQWNNGVVDRPVLRALIDDEGLELVGVGVTASPEVGVDVGILVGGDRVGVAVTTDLESLLAMIPDCVWYSGGATTDAAEGQDTIVRILRSGANAVAPDAGVSDLDAAWLAAARAAAEDAAATLLLPSLGSGDQALDERTPGLDALLGAVPEVCTARPGVLSWADLSLDETPEGDWTTSE